MKSSSRGLVLSPLAYNRLQFFCHAGPTEVGGYGLASADDPLYMVDFLLVQQECDPVVNELDNEHALKLQDQLISLHEIDPRRFTKIWCHTHPGNSPDPSSTDETTWKENYSTVDWCIMFILARGGATYTRLRCNPGPSLEAELPAAKVRWDDWATEGVSAWDMDDWRKEYETLVHPKRQRGHDPVEFVCPTRPALLVLPAGMSYDGWAVVTDVEGWYSAMEERDYDPDLAEFLTQLYPVVPGRWRHRDLYYQPANPMEEKAINEYAQHVFECYENRGSRSRDASPPALPSHATFTTFGDDSRDCGGRFSGPAYSGRPGRHGMPAD